MRMSQYADECEGPLPGDVQLAPTAPPRPHQPAHSVQQVIQQTLPLAPWDVKPEHQAHGTYTDSLGQGSCTSCQSNQGSTTCTKCSSITSCPCFETLTPCTSTRDASCSPCPTASSSYPFSCDSNCMVDVDSLQFGLHPHPRLDQLPAVLLRLWGLVVVLPRHLQHHSRLRLLPLPSLHLHLRLHLHLLPGRHLLQHLLHRLRRLLLLPQLELPGRVLQQAMECEGNALRAGIRSPNVKGVGRIKDAQLMVLNG